MVFEVLILLAEVSTENRTFKYKASTPTTEVAKEEWLPYLTYHTCGQFITHSNRMRNNISASIMTTSPFKMTAATTPVELSCTAHIKYSGTSHKIVVPNLRPVSSNDG